MTIIIPKILVKRGETIGNEIFVNFPELDTNITFLTTDYASGVSSFAIENGLKFADTNYIVVNNKGNEKCEILQISGSPTVSAMSLVSASSHAHNRGEQIQFIPFNQVVIESSTDNITFSPLTTLDLNPASQDTFYNDTTGTATTYYRVRFKNESDTTYSTYSDAILATGYSANSAGQIIQTALSDLGESIDGKVITKRFLFDALNEGRREIDEDKSIKRWPFRSVFNHNLYSIIPGQYKVAVPADLRDPETNKNIIGIRVGKDGRPCDYYDEQAFDNDYMTTYHTTLNGAIVTADTSITLTDSGDFDESGSIEIAGEDIDEVLDSVAYTANTETTNIISGVTGIRAAGHADGIDVWQNAAFGLPTNFTLNDGYIYFSQPFADDYAGESVYIDYYKGITDINSDGDELDEPFYNIYIPWLRFKIKAKKDKDLDWKNDIDYIAWLNKKEAQIEKNYLGQTIRLRVDIP